MTARSINRVRRRAVGQTLVALVASASLAVSPALAQTEIKPPKNKYTVEQDVQIGREAAAEVRKEYPIIQNDRVQDYLERLGEKLVRAAPPALNRPEFEYSFTPVNLKEINAFALPGGPMFVNRGMIEAAGTEGEVVGVMAHELSHVLLRHGTANATKAQGFQIGAIAGAIAGAIVGGGWGQVISQGSQFGLGTWLLKYSREYEKQADLLGAQIMARAGYDPRDLAHMFETIERQSKGGGSPEWLSSHPDPGNRTEYITREAQQLGVSGDRGATGDFREIKSAMASLPPAKSMAEMARRDTGGGDEPASVGTIGEPVPPPSSSYRTVRGGQLFQISVPSNWEGLSSNSSVKFVPQNAYGQVQGQSVFTHGVEVGVARAASQNLEQATNALLDALAQSNPDLRRGAEPQAVRFAGRQGIANLLINRSATGEQERVGIYTTFLSDGSLFYYLTIVPADEARNYENTFARVGNSIRLNDR